MDKPFDLDKLISYKRTYSEQQNMLVKILTIAAFKITHDTYGYSISLNDVTISVNKINLRINKFNNTKLKWSESEMFAARGYWIEEGIFRYFGPSFKKNNGNFIIYKKQELIKITDGNSQFTTGSKLPTKQFFKENESYIFIKPVIAYTRNIKKIDITPFFEEELLWCDLVFLKKYGIEIKI